jgi:Type IV secretion-system coupling protein DNA-binding domain
MNPETRYSSHWIVAAPGTGKTNLLLHMLASDLQKDACVITMDAKGELTHALRQCSIPGMRIIDPKNPVAINPLDIGEDAIDQLLFIFMALSDDSDISAKQEAFLRPLLRSIITAFPNPTLETVQAVINDKRPFQSHIDQLSPYLQQFFNREWDDYGPTRAALTWKFRLLLDNELVRTFFSSPTTRFKIEDQMNIRGPIIIDNSIALVGKAGSAFIGRYFMAQIWHGAIARYKHISKAKFPVFVILDEADAVIDSTIADIIDRCRAANLALILAHQRKGQIHDSNVLNALESCAIKMTNPIPTERDYFAKILEVPTERMSDLKRGQFAAHIRYEGSSIIQIPKAQLPFRTMTPQEEIALKARMKRDYGVRPEDLQTHKAPEVTKEASRESTTPPKSPPETPRTETPAPRSAQIETRITPPRPPEAPTIPPRSAATKGDPAEPSDSW